MPIIETHELAKTYKLRRQVIEAVRGVDLCVDEGQIFGFLGPNGAGKTTTLRMLTTLLPASGGWATIAGHDLRRESDAVRRRIGYVSQTGGTDPKSTGRENLILQARLYRMDKAAAVARAADLLRLLDLESVAERVAKTYSGGQKRRLDLALGMVHNPPLLFLDEPTNGLDPQSRARLWDEIRAMRQRGTTIFLTTHYLDEADALCDKLAIIDAGKIVVEGTPAALKQQVAGDVVTLGLEPQGDVVTRATDVMRAQPFVREVQPTDDGLRLYVARGEEALPHILRLLDGAAIGLRTIALARPSLDDVFLRQTGRTLRESDAAPRHGRRRG